MLPTKFVPIVTAGVGNIKKVALQSALQRLGIGHLQFLSVTSVLPSDTAEGEVDELRHFSIGCVLPAILSIHYVQLPPSEPRLYGASLFFFPAYRAVISPAERFYLAVEDCADASLDARLISDTEELKSAIVGYESAYRDSICLGIGKWLCKVEPLERHLASFAAVTPAKIVVSLYDSKFGRREWLVDDLRDQRWLCLLSGIVFSDWLVGGDKGEIPYHWCRHDFSVGSHS
jgi:hypothetical protein